MRPKFQIMMEQPAKTTIKPSVYLEHEENYDFGESQINEENLNNVEGSTELPVPTPLPEWKGDFNEAWFWVAVLCLILIELLLFLLIMWTLPCDHNDNINNDEGDTRNGEHVVDGVAIETTSFRSINENEAYNDAPDLIADYDTSPTFMECNATGNSFRTPLTLPSDETSLPFPMRN